MILRWQICHLHHFCSFDWCSPWLWEKTLTMYFYWEACWYCLKLEYPPQADVWGGGAITRGCGTLRRWALVGTWVTWVSFEGGNSAPGSACFLLPVLHVSNHYLMLPSSIVRTTLYISPTTVYWGPLNYEPQWICSPLGSFCEASLSLQQKSH